MSRKKISKGKKTGARPQVSVTSGTESFPAWLTNQRLHLIAIFSLAFLLYANTLSHDYALDDAIVITENMYTSEGISGFPGILSKDTFFGFFKEEGKAQLVAGGRYRPFTLLLFAIEVQLFGTQPWVGHLMNILYFGLTGIVLYLLLLRLFRLRFSAGKAYFVALAATLLFVAHPIHTEVVANIKGRDEIISLLGSLSALYFCLRAYLEKKPRWNLLAGVLFFAALLSKENAITFLAVVPLTFYFFTKAKTGNILKQLAPLAVAAVVFLVIRFSILGFSLGEAPRELMNNPFLKIVGTQWVPFSFGEKMATILYTLGKYLQLLVFPHPLTHDYYPKHIYLMSWGDWQVLLSLIAYIGLIVYAVRGFRRRDPVSYSILFFLLTISIVSNILFPVGTNMSERLIFMPSVGFCLAIAILAWRLQKQLGEKLVPVFASISLIALLFGIKTVVRNQAWEDNFTLFSTDIYHSPNSAKLRNAMGGELLTQSLKPGNESTQQAMWQEAVGHLQEAIRLHPTYKGAYVLLGNAYNYLKQFDQSIAAYQQALQISPGDQLAEDNLAITYRDAGKYAGETRGNLQLATQYLQQALQMRPNEAETLRLLGVAAGMGGQHQQSIDYFSRVTELTPNSATAWFDLGVAYIQSGQPQVGQIYIDRAKEIDPNIEAQRRQGQ
ncbi:tetratricopeptide repeat protein [Flavilitoribacter nigricans]|uniref:Glycosyltransferase RgtA/B/C/D-like domain-containing protein n=1 Tax=Flavilitoribacter nigricans (strain ATCC 23147 / DSM 23189 / NBRC 102662 / NCIMB 1420 / SS-2) TaxID=1122177 RepID=A0A2D0MYW6_FLAN2|nr:tetratricopeptide repeat protein [Flavilitoribacter nigricans]PHN01316.1 hypothetical protein CRP01_37795 [Flavilitoribacter nigricans DSM 23189 = NBRC 102662]